MNARGDERTSGDEQQQPPRRTAWPYLNRRTATMPGTGGTLTGTAINDLLDDEGNPTVGDPGERLHAEDNLHDDDGEAHEPPD